MFQDGGNFSSDQLALIAGQVSKRSQILNKAMDNLDRTMKHLDFRPPAQVSKSAGKPNSKQIVKKTAVPKPAASNQETLKGKVSYKVKGPDGKPMNIAEIKARINSIYDGEQGIIKQ